MSTLRFAQRAKEMKNLVTVNTEMSASEMKKLIETLKAEITQLKGGGGVQTGDGPASGGGVVDPATLDCCMHHPGCVAALTEGFDCSIAAAELEVAHYTHILYV